MTTRSSIEQRARELQDYIANGKVIEAMHEFYADDVAMQENLGEPCVGRAANIAREEAWLATVREFKRFDVLTLAASDTTSFVESAMEYIDQEGATVAMTQVSRATWKDGRIVHERFYHG